ncbi:MAG: DNA polymerase III subunit gamma/tau [Bacilli bacterium]|jgi:DNA polymerase-3 subunit gamma/tau|nr:DNA polymerase III subunit gamma/tau [Bacilli bacterium]
MEYKVLYRKYRPDSFKNIVGQDFTKTMLQNAVKNKKISHAYIFTGPRGTGKTSTAKVFAKSINCEHPIDGEACGTCNSCLNFLSSSDIIEIDAASNNGVDEVRELINNVKIAPTNSKYKIYIIDEVHMMTQSAFNALLLTLEEPPSHVIFIMATTNIESVPITILSRCQRFDFKKFSIEELVSQIKYVCKQENIQITNDAVEEIAYISEGGMRDALSLVDQLSANSTDITIENILSNYGSISIVFIKNIVQSLLNKDIKTIMSLFDELKRGATDYKIFIKKLIQELMIYCIKLKTEYITSNLSYEEVKCIVFELNDCMNRANINVNPYSLIELILLGYIKNDFVKDPMKSKVEEDLKNNDSINENVNNITHEVEDTSLEEKSLQNHFLEIKTVRINNCFCGAKKNILQKLQQEWLNIMTSPIPDDILNLLVDSKIVAASESHVIIATNVEGTAILINNRLLEITDYLCEFFAQEFTFIALSESEWLKEKQIYIENLHNGKTYEMLSEKNLTIPLDSVEKREPSLEKIAQELFDHDKIEIV